jgi:hypothetical protein
MFDLFLRNFEDVRQFLLTDHELSEERKLLIGSYFLSEFSLESAALFNPSIVPHPDQSNLPSGALRFILSLRATGEGHISCITFRSGIIHNNNRIEIDPPTRYVTEPQRIPNPVYKKSMFKRKLFELRLTNEFTLRVMDRLSSSFMLEQLRTALDSELREVWRMDGGGGIQQHGRENLVVGRIQLRSAISSGPNSLRANDLSSLTDAKQWDRGCPVCSL